jgi:hypothetical protein
MSHLYQVIDVPKLPKMHWFDSSGWHMIEFLYTEVCDAIKIQRSVALFLIIMCNETTNYNNSSWMSVHTYI